MLLLSELSLNELFQTFEQLAEDVSWDAGKPLDGQLKQAADQFAAAARALGIANRLKDPTSRKKHRSRIMGMLNVLRASLSRLELAIAGEIEGMAA